MKKTNKKLASAIVLGLMLSVPVGASADTIGSHNTSSNESIILEGKYDYGIKRDEGGISNYDGKQIIINNAPDTWESGQVGVRATYTPTGEQRAIINLGNEKTEIVSVNIVDNSDNNDVAIGLWASGKVDNTGIQGGQINVKGNELRVTGHTENGWLYGIYAQNSTTTSKNALAEINIDTDNTYINVTSGENAAGDATAIIAMSQGRININSNLEVYGDSAIVARGDAVVKVNEDGTHTTKLNGDINFSYDGSTSGTKVDADVTVNLTGADSYWNGNTTVSWNYASDKKPDDNMLKVQDFKLTIADGAQWNPNKIDRTDTEYTDDGKNYVAGGAYLALNNLTLNGGIINLDKDKMGDQALEIEKLGGTGGIVNTNSLENSIEIGELVAGDDQSTPSITVNGSGNIADQIYKDKNNEENIAQKLADVVVTSGGTTAADKVTTDEGIIAGRYSFDINADGTVDTANGSYTKNTKNEAISNMASIGLMSWRAQNNDMNKRLGELRNSNGEHGVWTRMVRGESEYGAQNVKNQYNIYQLGYDEKLSTNDNWTVGAAISYSEGNSSFEYGSGEDKSTGFAVYGSYLGDNGEFVDLIAKYARLDNEFDVTGGVGSGDYSTNGYSFSAEYGKRNQLANDFYFEPQVELTYGRVADVDFVTDSGAKVSQDSMDSLVGRVGFAAGKNIKNGNVYVRASYLYDFDGETNVTFSNASGSESFSEDLGGGWFEFGIGTNINLSDATYLYLDVEKTTGGEVDTNWQWNAGVRYSF